MRENSTVSVQSVREKRFQMTDWNKNGNICINGFCKEKEIREQCVCVFVCLPPPLCILCMVHWRSGVTMQAREREDD